MDLDDIYVQIGEFGLQQRIYFFLIGLFNFYAPLQLLQVVFTGQKSEFICKTNETLYKDTCPDNKIELCNEINFVPYPDSFTKDWLLICSDGYKARIVQSIFMSGVMMGAITLGPFADKYGRRRVLISTLFFMVLGGSLGSIITNFYLYLAFRFITGFSAAGNMLSSYVLYSELIGPSKRGICGNIYMVFFSIGIVFYSGLAWLINSWRLLSFISSLSGGILIFVFLVIPESPRWLLTHERSREARNILKLISDRNGSIFPSDLEISVPAPCAKKGSLLDIFKRKKTCISTMIQIYSWFVNSAVYYGLTLASDSLGSNLYISTMLSGIVEIPSYIIGAILIDWVGRKIPLAGFMIIGGISCLFIQFLPSKNVILILALLGKLSISASFSIIYIHTTELFPTVIRTSGLGICSLAARLGGIVAPFFSVVNSISPSLQFTFFGLLSISSGILNLLLPETLNRTLPETLDDLSASQDLIRRNERGRYSRIEANFDQEDEDLSDDEDTIYSASRVKN